LSFNAEAIQPPSSNNVIELMTFESPFKCSDGAPEVLSLGFKLFCHGEAIQVPSGENTREYVEFDAVWML
jgi:hypothetical protein